MIRHLVLPNGLAGTAQVVDFLAREVSRNTYLNVMAQYHPAGRVSRSEFAEINRYHVSLLPYLLELSQQLNLPLPLSRDERLGTAWRAPAFDDTAWPSGTLVASTFLSSGSSSKPGARSAKVAVKL